MRAPLILLRRLLVVFLGWALLTAAIAGGQIGVAERPALAQPAPEVTQVVSCLAGSGRVDTNIVNTGDDSADYRIEFEGLSPRQATIDAGDWWRMPITGRPDRPYDVLITRDGLAVLDTTIVVDCDDGPTQVSPAEVQLVNACRNSNGYLLFQFVNPRSVGVGYVIEFDGVSNRSTSATAAGQSVRAVTGRPDGTYGWRIRTDGVLSHTGSVEVDCDPGQESPINLPPIADDLVALPPQPAGVVFPTLGWPEGPVPARADGAAVSSILNAAFGDQPQLSRQGSYGSIDAAVVVSGGAIVAERYGSGYDGMSPHVSWSVAKSVTHALLGVLAGDGQLDMLAPAAVPEWSGAADPRAAITPDQLARMSSGLDWTENFDAPLIFFTSGLGAAAPVQANRDLVAGPNTQFEYSTGSTAINARLMADLVGRDGLFDSWADQVLFDRLGIDSVELAYDNAGNWVGGWGANMDARDFARFGLLYLRDGMWDGQRVLPAGWVDYARSPSVTNPSYGSGFWIDSHGDDTFSAIGLNGQIIAVAPELDLVVVILSSDTGGSGSSALATDLIAAFTPLPAG